PYLYWAAIALAGGTLVRDLGRPGTRGLVVAFLGVSAAAGVLLLVHPLLSRIESDRASAVLAFVSLLPIALVAAIDFAGSGRRLVWSGAPPGGGEDLRLFSAAARGGGGADPRL